ncbi:MAG: GNAT family N-acetyltransferase [Planctomycetota bacterium]|nr:GNAT family N-acetyltransferase [Planctomycetota bacterium]
MHNTNSIIEPMTREDFLDIVDAHEAFWESDQTLRLHHPIFIEEFGDTAYVIRENEHIVAYLLGFISQNKPTAYIHMVAVRRDIRGKGYARILYDHFASIGRERGCTRLKATVDAHNELSLRFHIALGMEMQGELAEEAAFEGVKIVKDYLRRGSHRVVFLKDISPSASTGTEPG